jgi:PAS domain S-box-containing protein
MDRTLRLLIVEDSDDDAQLMIRELRRRGYRPEHLRVETAAKMETALGETEWDVVLSDYSMPGFGGVQALELLKKSGLDLPFIIVSGKIGEETAVGLMKAGAHDYILKDRLARLAPAIERELQEAGERRRRREAEEALRRAEEEWERTFNAITDPLMVIDTAYRITKANRAMAERLGMGQKELFGACCYRVLDGLSEPPEECPFSRLLADKAPHATEIRMEHLKGDFFVSVSPLFNPDGSLFGAVHYSRDISEQKRAGEEQKRLETQLRQAQKMEAIGTLTGGIAHDFNNILTAIIGFSSITKMKLNKQDPLQADIDQILEASDRAAHLTRSLLAYSRKQIMAPRTVDLNDIVRNGEKFLRRVIGEDVEFISSFSQAPMPIFADSMQIEQVLMNLATNARDAMPDGGTLSITTDCVVMDDHFLGLYDFAKRGVYALLSLSDTGVGMDEATVKRIFEPFFTTKEVGQGTGLGLSVAYGIIRQHDGFITCYSEPGSGTTFRIYLPLIHGEVEKDTPTPETVLPEGKETILIAEDDGASRGVSKRLLENFGYTVIEAADGEEAVTKFREYSDDIDLILLDVVMPKLNGREVYRRIREMNPDAKIIFMSGYAADIIRMDEIVTEGMKVLSKPGMLKKLAFTIREVLDS